MNYLTFTLATLALSSATVIKPPERIPANFELLILHNNDMHARFEQTSQLSGACTTADRDAGKCYGGFPRVAYVVKEARRKAATGEGPPVLYLNAGDTYTGTAWFTIYKWKIAAEFINALRPDAVSLGTNDFENGSDKLSPFLEEIQTNIMTSNVFLNDANQKLQKSIIVDVNGISVAIVGYLTPDARLIENQKIEYIDEIIALKEEVTNLKAQNVQIIIALGHSDSNIDQEIAKEVEGIDLVINGYKNKFSWDGNTADSDSAAIDEITTQTQQSGKIVPVIQSHAYDKYLGSLKIMFDREGSISGIKIKNILLDNSIPQDPEAVEIIEKYTNDIVSTRNVEVGNTAVVLDGDSCAVEECNYGNLIADAIVYHYALNYEGERWSDAPIAIIHSGAITSSIAPSNRPAAVYSGDIMSSLPSESRIVAVTMSGAVLTQLLEHAVSEYSLTASNDEFLQFSGVRVVYDLAEEPGSRVVSAVVRCWDCFIPQFFTIDDWRTYKILMPLALANGEFGYTMLNDLPREDLDYDEITCTTSYISLRSPVYPEVAERINILNVDPVPDSTSSLVSSFIVILLTVTSILFIY